MNLRRMTKRERNIALTTLTVAVTAALYVYAIEPVVTDWLTLVKQAGAAEKDLAQLRSLVEHKDTIEREYKRLQGAVATGRNEQELKVALFNEIDVLAKANGLQVSSVRPTVVKKEGSFHRYGAELQVHCGGHDLVKLLQKLQEPEHLLRTDSMTITAGPGEPPLTVTLQISKLTALKG